MPTRSRWLMIAQIFRLHCAEGSGLEIHLAVQVCLHATTGGMVDRSNRQPLRSNVDTADYAGQIQNAWVR